MSWAFAIINNRLAEMYFEKKGKVFVMEGHCYVKREEFTTKSELKDIDTDTKKHVLSYRKGVYRDKLSGLVFHRDKPTRL
jgi:hypothetical protein